MVYIYTYLYLYNVDVYYTHNIYRYICIVYNPSGLTHCHYDERFFCFHPIFPLSRIFSVAVGPVIWEPLESPGQGTMLADSWRCPKQHDLQNGSENCFVASALGAKEMGVKTCQICVIF